MNKKNMVSTTLLIALLTVVLFVGVWQIKPAQATTDFNSGLETGDLSDFTGYSGSTTPTVQGTIVHSGAYAVLFSCISTGSSRVMYNFSSTGVKNARGYLYVDYAILTGTIYHMLSLRNNAGFGQSIRIDYNSTNGYAQWAMRDEYFGTVFWGPQVVINTWYLVEMRCSDISGQKLQWWINEVPQQNSTYASPVHDLVFLSVGSTANFGGATVNIYGDDVATGDSYIGPVEMGVGNIGKTAEVAGTECKFYANWSSTNYALDSYVFSWDNGTFTMTPDAKVTFTTTWSNITKTLNYTAGSTIHWQITANNTNGDSASIGLRSFITASAAPTYLPQYMFTKQHTAGATAQFCVRWDANLGSTMAHSICRNNVTGSFVNETTVDLSGSSAWHNQSVTLPAYNTKVGFLFFGESTEGVWNTTQTYIFLTMNGTMALHTEGEYVYDDTGTIITLKGFGDTNTQNQEYYNGHWFGKDDSPGSGFNTWDVSAIEENLDAMKMWGATCLRYRISYEWWATTDGTKNCQSKIQQLCALAASRGIYILLNPGIVNATQGSPAFSNEYRDASSGVPWPPFLNNANSTAILPSAEEWIEWHVNVSKTMGMYSNFLQEFHNEPYGDAEAKAAFLNVSNYAIPACRNESDVLLVIQWGYATISSSDYSMSWVNTLSCYGQWNILYSTHLYRDGYTSQWTFTYSTLLSSYQTQMFTYTIDAHKPLFIGEIGCNIWLENDPNFGVSGQINENAWFNNTLYILNQRTCGNMIWWWYFYGPYGVFSYTEASATSIARPLCNGLGSTGYLHGDTGNIVISNWHTHPFVFSIGNTTHAGSDYGNYYIYGNNTVSNSVWTNPELTITLTVAGLAQVRVWWNLTQSTEYPINSSLLLKFNNGTTVNASPFYVAYLNMLVFNITDSASTSVQVGYNLETVVFVTVSSPSNVTYNSGTISIVMDAVGGMIDDLWWNCKNGTNWIYGLNQTYVAPASLTGFINGTSYTFYGWANNTDGTVDVAIVMFTVGILIVEIEWGGYWGRWWGYP